MSCREMHFSSWAPLIVFWTVTIAYGQIWEYSDTCEHEDGDDVEDDRGKPLLCSVSVVTFNNDDVEEDRGSAAFSIKLTSVASPGVVHFNKILTEVGVYYNQDTGRIRILRDGIYSIHWNHVSRSRFAKSQLRVDNRIVAAVVSDVFPTRQFLIDDASTSGTFLLQKSNELSILTNETIESDSFFTGFLIKDVSTSAFYATTRSNFQGSGIFFARFENILLNSNLDFRGDQFVASSDGLYVFSATTSSFEGNFPMRFIINDNETKSVFTGEFQIPGNVPGTGFTLQTFRTLSSESLTCVFKLKKGDVIRVQVSFAFGTSVIEGNPWIFTGFKYLDTGVVQSPAATVLFDIQQSCSPTCNPLENALVRLDNANNFSPATGQFTAQKEGLYVIAVTCLSDVRSSYEIFVSNKSVTSVIIEGPDNVVFWSNGGKRVLIQYMRPGDTVRMNVVSIPGIKIGSLSIWALPSYT